MHPSPSSNEPPSAADSPSVATHIPDVPWLRHFGIAVLIALALLAAWEWRLRGLQLAAGDLDDSASAWAEQRRRIDTGTAEVVIVGDSRILFGTDFDRFEALTGRRPIQLALTGTPALPVLQDLAGDADFHGLVLVGISELVYFRVGPEPKNAVLERYRSESPVLRSEYVLRRALEQTFAFLDEHYRLGTLAHRMDRGWREGAPDPYDEVWKVASSGADRETWLWPRIVNDTRLRAHARHAWIQGKVAVVGDDVIRATLAATADAVARIRAHGGEVVFLRPPSAYQFRFGEEHYLPRDRGWDALLAAARVQGIHFEDDPAMQGLDLPEYSHLTHACARVYTDAYVRAVATRTSRLRLLANAPTALAPADCRTGAVRR